MRTREGTFGIYFASCAETREVYTKITHSSTYIFSIYKEFRLFYVDKRCLDHNMYQVYIFDNVTDSTLIQMYTFHISQMCDNSMLLCGFRLESCSA